MIQKAYELIQTQQYKEALDLLFQLQEQGEDSHNLYYLIGQCYRYLNNYTKAIQYLEVATQKEETAPYLLALGIALQLDEQYEFAIDIFKQSIHVDKNYLLAYNSLALTYKRIGKYQTAADTYEQVLHILGYQIIFDMTNDRETVFVSSNFSDNNLWVQYAIASAIYFSKDDNIQSVSWPSGDFAEKEEREHNYEGLYWVDQEDNEGKVSRLFLPNYFNTYKMLLANDKLYANFTGDRGLILELLDDGENAEQHFNEASEFMHLYEQSIE